MFSGDTGAVVASDEGLATSAPSYGLVKDVVKVVEALPEAPFRIGMDAPPLSAAPTLWARPRAVIESGGGRPPCLRPLGGGRASLEGAQQPSGLELGSFGPHSHDMPASPALSPAL